jgi:HPt (histidine-containing phosphotransfer) domain-containing protein
MRFDKMAFQNLIDGDKSLFTELLRLYNDEYPRLLEELRAAVRVDDGGGVEKIAHRLKGMVRNFFAPAAVAVAGEIEEAGRIAVLNGLFEKIGVLEIELDHLKKELTEYLNSFN